MQNDYGDKPAVVAMRTLTNAARGRTFAGFLPVGFTSMHAMLLVGATDRVVALWSDAPGSVTPVTVPANAKGAVDMLGAPVALGSDGGLAVVTVRETAGPVFVTFPNPGSGASDGGAAGGSDASPSPADAGGLDGSGNAASGGSGSSSGCGCVVAGSGVAALTAAPFAAALAWLLAFARRGRRRAP